MKWVRINIKIRLFLVFESNFIFMFTAEHLLLESTTKSVESGTYDVICHFCTVKGMVVEPEILKAQSCASSK